MSWRGLLLVAGLLIIAREAAHAQPRPDDDQGGPPRERRLALFGTAELELVDVEGPGGSSAADTSQLKPRRRAPVIDVDKATFDFGMRLEPQLRARVELRADRSAARIDRVYLDWSAVELPGWQVLVQAGRQKPMQRPPERRVETYSPLGALFWRGREWHLGADARFRAGEVDVRGVASVAMQRDLDDQVMGEDASLPALGFGDTEPRRGAAAEVGGLLGASARGGHAEIFAFRGRLLDNDGPERLKRTFLEDYIALGNIDVRTDRWFGARAGYRAHRVHLLTEGILQHVGRVRRRGFELGGSYTVPVRWRNRTIEIEPFVRWGMIATTNLPARPLIPEGWDRQQLVTALLLRPSGTVEIKLEYLFLVENTAQDSGQEVPVNDDQLLIHLRLTQELL